LGPVEVIRDACAPNEDKGGGTEAGENICVRSGRILAEVKKEQSVTRVCLIGHMTNGRSAKKEDSNEKGNNKGHDEAISNQRPVSEEPGSRLKERKQMPGRQIDQRVKNAHRIKQEGSRLNHPSRKTPQGTKKDRKMESRGTETIKSNSSTGGTGAVTRAASERD